MLLKLCVKQAVDSKDCTSQPVLSKLSLFACCSSIVLLVMTCMTGCDSTSDEEYQSYANAEQPEKQTQPTAKPPTDTTMEDASFEQQVIVPVKAVKPVKTTVAAKPAVSTQQKYQVLVPTREFRSEGDSNTIRLSYDDLDLLKVLGQDEVQPGIEKHFPDWLTQLDGKRVVLRGFMYPPFSETGIKRFAFARDNQICCFGRNPKIYDLFLVTLKDGVTTNYIANRPFDVAGIFHIDPVVEDGELLQLYEISDAVVLDK